MVRSNDSAREVDELLRLARRFAESESYEEASRLYEMALRLDPTNMGAQLSLAQIRRLMDDRGRERPRDLLERHREQLRRSALDAKHFLGLARLYRERGDDERAHRHLQIAEAKDLPNPAPHKLEAELLIGRKEFSLALVQLLQARRFDPFDRETARLLARCRYETKDYEGALTGYIDAFLLLPDTRREEAGILRDRIHEIRESLDWDNEGLTRLFRQRQEHLRILFDRLEWHRDRLLEDREAPDEGTEDGFSGTGRLALATRLRELAPWAHLTDEQIFLLTESTHEERHEEGDLVFAAGTPGADVFVLEEGEITVRRDTPYGSFPLGLLRAGEIFGEVNFVTRGERTADAVASEPVRLLRLDARELEDLVARRPRLGVQLYWSFWHALAFKLRCTNEQLRTFFTEEDRPEQLLRLRETETEKVRRASVDEATKIALFQEQGLDGEELSALASFSRERTYPQDVPIFREGDEGREMFVVLEGAVRISKVIPGAGEEALAILRRGDFFGEMALIDGQPRSADAVAHEGDATVVALEENTIREVLSADPKASLEFLTLLCRLIANRLREIDEKVIGWRIMAGEAGEGSPS
ncbi:MAG: cyclic nucleotide-binding domain-containing protein [Thermoanaerobaculia bacterium]|nr:cyclic nucleotide-binding domain-containing protein [Thermoanaerobaculia bacterium]